MSKVTTIIEKLKNHIAEIDVYLHVDAAVYAKQCKEDLLFGYRRLYNEMYADVSCIRAATACT